MGAIPLEAMKKIKLINGQVDLAIVDIGLPDRKRDAFVNERRALYPHLPIVIASGYHEAGLRERFGAAPLISFLRKSMRAPTSRRPSPLRAEAGQRRPNREGSRRGRY